MEKSSQGQARSVESEGKLQQIGTGSDFIVRRMERSKSCNTPPGKRPG